MQLKLLKNEQMQLGAMTFFARPHKGETCGSNGLPLTPNSITIYGRSQILKTILHPNLCQYLDIIRGKHERTIVVAQYCGQPLVREEAKNAITIENITKIAFQIITALDILHSQNIVHRNLSSDNILLQSDGTIKLFNFGLYYMTGNGKYVTFPIGHSLYAAPEIYIEELENLTSGYKVDIWSLGIILAELSLGISLWSSLKLGQGIRKVLSLIKCNSSVFEKISREHNCFEKYQNIPTELKNLIEACLTVNPKDRPTSKELLERDIFEEYRQVEISERVVVKKLENIGLVELYHWYLLAGGDVYQELKKQGLIRSCPPVLSLPNMVPQEGMSYGEIRNYATLYDPRVIQISLESLYTRFGHLKLNHFYPLIHTKSQIILNAEPDRYDISELPLIIRERDPEYQFHRVILFRRLLHGYPYTRDLIVKEAKTDIPPLLRGQVWAALLDVKGNYEEEFCMIDKETPTPTDRQIEVDIPRCHQYNELLSSEEGHKKLKRILKAWITKNPQYVYWQGLDSLTAPFIYLNFNYEAKAFACLLNFVPKYLHNFFLKDNSAIIQEYLTKFSHLIAFHDPELANHLHEINFIPELFAIPWFLTMFSHVFPFHKILHLWDKLLLGDSSFPLHVGLAILTQLRDTLLASGFNECILLFSDLPEVDIELCVIDSTRTYECTPKSVTIRLNQNYQDPKTELNITDLSNISIHQEYCPRISTLDVLGLLGHTEENQKHNTDQILLVDVRSNIHYARASVECSINIPFSIVKLGETNLESLGTQGTILNENIGKVIVVIGEVDSNPELFSRFLVKCRMPKVCILHGGINILHSVNPGILITKRQQ